MDASEWIQRDAGGSFLDFIVRLWEEFSFLMSIGTQGRFKSEQCSSVYDMGRGPALNIIGMASDGKWFIIHKM